MRYPTAEVPEVCPACGSRLRAPLQGSAGVRELNLASPSFLGALGRGEATSFLVDVEAGEERPPEARWIACAYECAGCGEVLASGTVDSS